MALYPDLLKLEESKRNVKRNYKSRKKQSLEQKGKTKISIYTVHKTIKSRKDAHKKVVCTFIMKINYSIKWLYSEKKYQVLGSFYKPKN